MWIQAGEYRKQDSEPPTLERLKAMLRQCKVRGLGGCNCRERCVVEVICQEEVKHANE